MSTTSTGTTISSPQYILVGESAKAPICLTADLGEPEEGRRLQIAVTRPTQTPPPNLSEVKVSLSELEAGYALAKAITINIRRLDRNNYVAKFPDANINASGESFPVAITHLKALIVDMFDLLQSVPRNRLGPEPKQQLTILNGLIRKTI
jgi:hypothetical protein